MTEIRRVTLDDFNSIPASDNGEPDSWRPVDLNTFPEQPPIQPTLGDVGLVYPGARHVFSGPPESAKTLAAYAIALKIVRAGLEVIVIDFEMGPYDTRQRLRELGATPDEISRFLYLEPETHATPERIGRLILLRPALVIIDAAAGAYHLEHLDDNKRADAEMFTSMYVRGFWKAGIATLVLDHVPKSKDNRGAFTIGSERKVGGAQVHLGFETLVPVSRGTSGKYKIVTHKDRGGYLKRGHVATLELDSDPETHAITWTFTAVEHSDQPFRPTVYMQRVSEVLEAAGEPMSRSRLEHAVIGKSTYKRDAINILLSERYIEETDGPGNSRPVRSVRPYREADEPADEELVFDDSDIPFT